MIKVIFRKSFKVPAMCIYLVWKESGDLPFAQFYPRLRRNNQEHPTFPTLRRIPTLVVHWGLFSYKISYNYRESVGIAMSLLNSFTTVSKPTFTSFLQVLLWLSDPSSHISLFRSLKNLRKLVGFKENISKIKKYLMALRIIHFV